VTKRSGVSNNNTKIDKSYLQMRNTSSEN